MWDRRWGCADAEWPGGVETMNSRDEQIRALCARQAGDWFAAHRAGALSASEQQAFQEWLLASPMNVEEYLGVTSIARALPQAADDPECPLDTILSRAIGSERHILRPAQHESPESLAAETRRPRAIRWGLAAAAALAVVSGGILWRGDSRFASWHYATGHGGQQTVRLADNSILHLNTDTSLTVRYGRGERVVDIDHGQAFFVVTHDSDRPFRVIVGQTDVVAVGTQFDVYRQIRSTLVTVLEGRVSVGSVGSGNPRIQVAGGEQVRLSDGLLPVVVSPVDVQSFTAWLRRQIVFDHEPLALVAAEFNRYSAIPIEIESPSLKAFVVSGVFSVGDTDTFLAFLRSLHGVRVDSTPARIRVTGQPTATPARPAGVR